MERVLGVEKARGNLGKLAEEVAAGEDAVILTKRGEALAVLVSREEYARLKTIANRFAQADLQERLTTLRQRVRSAGLDSDVVDEAIQAARQLS